MVREVDKVVTLIYRTVQNPRENWTHCLSSRTAPHLHKTYNVFHVSVLRHYVVDESHKLNWKELQVSDMGTLMVEPLHILDRRVRQLRNRLVDQVKVQWNKYSPGSATWEDAETLR
jgi:hypothetical protein